MAEQVEVLYRSLFDSVSHELKTPLTAIRGAVSVLESRATEPKAIVEQIGEESERLIQVVDHMLNMTRLESGTLKLRMLPCDIADIFGPALSQIESHLKGRVIQVEVKKDTPPLLCDAPLVVQALVNVIHNALKHTPPGPIEISAQADKVGFVEIQVRDHGPGLPLEHPEIVFQKFYRKGVGGAGLGLSIAKGFIECQGGTISAMNHMDGGAVFKIRLQASGEE